MKARSAVFTGLVRPATVFGLPPMLFAAIASVAMVAGLLTSLIGLGSLVMLMLALVLLAGWMIAFKAARRDHHIDSVFRTAAAFWGLRRSRWLLAGAHGPVPASVRRRRRRGKGVLPA